MLPLPKTSEKTQAQIEAWLRKNGGPRRFERGASADIDLLRMYVRGKGYEIGFKQGGVRPYTIRGGNGRPRQVSRKGLIEFVDTLRAADGLPPITAPTGAPK